MSSVAVFNNFPDSVSHNCNAPDFPVSSSATLAVTTRNCFSFDDGYVIILEIGYWLVYYVKHTCRTGMVLSSSNVFKLYTFSTL